MSEYTFEIRTGLLTGENTIHTWIQITKPVKIYKYII